MINVFAAFDWVKRFDARSTRYSTLVGCTRTRHIQAMHDRLQVSARNGTDISVADVPVWYYKTAP